MSSTYLGVLACPRCSTSYPEDAAFSVCPKCAADGQNVNPMPTYDLTLLGADWAPDDTQPGIFRYRDLLPIGAGTEPVSIWEGRTPLIPVPALAGELGIGELLIKDESRNPTWSYKDRLAAVGVTKAREAGAQTVVVSSTGNHGAAVAAYAAAAGLRCVVLTLESVPQTMKVLMQSYGAHVVALRNPPDRWLVMRAAMAEHGWVPLSGFLNPPAGSNPFAVDGYKTMAYEIVDSLGRAPDVVVTPVAYGDGIAGLHRGFADLLALGVIESMPRLVAAEVFGPYGSALASGLPGASSAVPAGPSVAFSIATPVSAYQGWQAVSVTAGSTVAVADDGEILAAQLRLARASGIYLEASAALPIAGLGRLRAAGVLGAGDTVVCIGTSTGLKDIGATASVLDPVVTIEPTLAALEQTLR
jgi:threonine synthase